MAPSRTRLPIALVLLSLAAPARAEQAPGSQPGPVRPQPAPAPAQPQPAGPVPAPGPSAPRTLVMHVPPLTAAAGAPIELAAEIDAPLAGSLAVRWRLVGESAWRDATFERSSAGGWFATLPPAAPPGIEYFIAGLDGTGAAVAHFASEGAPHVVRVVPSLIDRLEALDRARQHGRRNEVALDVIGHNFGNRYDHTDYFLRGELWYTRRLARELHHVAFGFGAIQGRTPLEESATGGDASKRMRYGFGELRVRAHPSIFLDARGILGAGEGGFEGGIRGAITFGKPWRSCVAVGGEYLGGVGGTAWVRLQWDTAPPLLMGASVVRTDLPGAVIDPGGLFIAYDVSYRVADRLGLRAQLSYGARDGAAHVGGGLGTSIDF